MFAVIPIRTPTDFERSLSCQDYVHDIWYSLGPHEEPAVRAVVDEIFADLEYIGAETELTCAYRTGLEQPLCDSSTDWASNSSRP